MVMKTIRDITRYDSGYLIYQDKEQSEKAVTPGYFQLVRDGVKIPPLPYHHSRSKMSKSLFQYRRWGAGTAYFAALPFNTVLLPSTAYSLPNAKAIENFYQNAKSFDSTLAVTAAEFPKTIKLVEHAASRLYQVYRKLKRFDVYGAIKALGLDARGVKEAELLRKLNRSSRNYSRKTGRDKFAENAWLELQYGWLPLIQEVNAAISDLKKADGQSKLIVSVRSHGSHQGEHSVPIFGAEATKGEIEGSSYNVSIGYCGYFGITSEILNDAASLGIINLPAVAWELLPFSFVVDWFVPIGDMLNSLDAMAGTTYLYGCKSTRVTNVVDYRYPAGAVYYRSRGDYILDTDATLVVLEDSFNREVITSPPAAIDMFRVKPLEKAFSPKHSISAIALLSTVLT